LRSSESAIRLVKYTDNEWHLIPLNPRDAFAYSSFIALTGQSSSVSSISVASPRNQRFPNPSLLKHEFLPGRYRIVLINVALLPHKGDGMTYAQWHRAIAEVERRLIENYPPEEMHLPEDPPTYPGTRHTVWAEFVVY